VFTLFPVYLKDLSLTEDLIGVLTATGGLMGALLVLGVGRFIDRSGRKMMFIFAIGLYMMDWVVLVLTQNLIVVTIMWAIPIWAFIITSGTAMVSDLTSTEERGRGTGAINSALNMGQFIGALLSGVAAWYMAPILHLGPFRGAYLLAAFLLIPPLLIATRMTETLVLRRKGAGKEGTGRTAGKNSTLSERT
jgi:MFS family permease